MISISDGLMAARFPMRIYYLIRKYNIKSNFVISFQPFRCPRSPWYNRSSNLRRNRIVRSQQENAFRIHPTGRIVQNTHRIRIERGHLDHCSAVTVFRMP